MQEHTEADPTDPGTLRPNQQPLQSHGDHFEPLECPPFDHTITLPPGVDPSDPINLFLLYYNSDMVDLMVESTNEALRTPSDPEKVHSRAHSWYSTTTPEIYTYFAMRIYMTIIDLPEVPNYWDQSCICPKHPITNYINRNRFQELHTRFRYTPPSVKDIFKRV